MNDDRPDPRGLRRALEQLTRDLVADEPAWMAWFGEIEQLPPSPQRRVVYRGGASRARATQVVLRVVLFDDPYAGKGRVDVFELRLLGDGDRPGDPHLRIELRPVDSTDGDHPSGWTGPATGRLLLADGALDFDADHGSRLDQRHDALILEAHLEPAWIERDETHQELLAALDGLLVMREPL